MNVSVIVATYGDDEWRNLAQAHAVPSAERQGAREGEVFALHAYDGTLASVRNLAATKVSGDWLCFLDADDQLDDGYLSAIEYVEGREVGVFDRLYVPAVQYVAGDRRVGSAKIPSWGRPLIEINCAVIGTLISRHLFLKLGGFREVPMYEDWDLWLRAVIDGAKLVPVPQAVYLADADAGRNTQPALAEKTYWRIRSEHEAAFTSGRTS